MKKLDQAPEIHAIAQSLDLSTEGGAVSNILHHCHQRIQAWLKESGAVRSIQELESLICRKLKLVIEEVWTDDELNATCEKYLRQGEVIFAHVRQDFDEKTFATLVERKKNSPKSTDRYVAVVDCRGQKGLRRFFTRWHEIAHILTLNQQLEFRLHRTSSAREQEPGEKLMDTIAGEIGFYQPFFQPILDEELAAAGHLTFAVVESVRSRFCPEASYSATLNACLKKTPTAATLLNCGMGYKAEEMDRLESRHGLLLPEKALKPKLRLISVMPNAATKGKFSFHKNMTVPPSSVIHEFHSGVGGGSALTMRTESLQIWRHSDGRCLGFGSVRIEVRKVGEAVHALVTGL
jgi:hypothetical protein